MITDSNTNLVYLADSLPGNYPLFYPEFEKVLRACNIAFQLLPQTKDVWAVDYMPIQIDLNKFVRFTYKPSYLRSAALLKTISDADTICAQIGIETIQSNIVLDGGNVLRSANKVIMTDRIFKENPAYGRQELMHTLQDLLEIDSLFIIPEQPHDFTGHADGMVRFVDEHTLLINDYSKESDQFKKVFGEAIQKTGLDYITIPYNPYHNDNDEQAQGCYINYLQMEHTVIIPTFGMKEDEAAVKQFEDIFKGQTIATIDSNDIANDGGILNCITWNIKS